MTASVVVVVVVVVLLELIPVPVPVPTGSGVTYNIQPWIEEELEIEVGSRSRTDRKSVV